MAPARFTEKWQRLEPAERRLTGVRGLELADPAEEAQAIALALREALEEPGRTAALVTPDRALARRVSAHLRRWGIEADDSAGRPLSQTPPGTLLLAAANAAAERFAPVALLALLKHPLVMAQGDRLGWLDGARLLDRMLRGPRPAAGLDGIAAHLAPDGGRDGDLREAAASWWRDVMPLLRPLEAAADGESEPCRPARRGARGGDGAGRRGGLVGARRAAPRPRCSPSMRRRRGRGPSGSRRRSCRLCSRGCWREVAVRPPYGQHPRLFIWGLIEARLQHADLLVLGGLNEGTWPALPAPDPWLAPRLRADLGLPSLERRIGLAAHDFAAALGAPRVLVTRARRDARAPAIASRFWLQAGGDDRRPDPLARAADMGAGDRPARRRARAGQRARRRRPIRRSGPARSR